MPVIAREQNARIMGKVVARRADARQPQRVDNGCKSVTRVIVPSVSLQKEDVIRRHRSRVENWREETQLRNACADCAVRVEPATVGRSSPRHLLCYPGEPWRVDTLETKRLHFDVGPFAFDVAERSDQVRVLNA
jgi:hypothetical protein